MPQRPSGRVDRTASSLAELQLADETLDSILVHIGRIGVHTLEGWDAAAATLIEGNVVATFGSTDERVNPLDQNQYDTGKGLCVDALKGEVNYFDGTSDQPRWRQFAEVAGQSGFYSVVSFPLTIDGEVFGALNFYSGERDALRTGQREEGLAFAAQAAVAIANAKKFAALGAQVEQLEEGLNTRTMIGQATGILMAQEGLTSDEAFKKLVQVSQHANVKLRDIAQRYVTAWEETVAAREDGA